MKSRIKEFGNCLFIKYLKINGRPGLFVNRIWQLFVKIWKAAGI